VIDEPLIETKAGGSEDLPSTVDGGAQVAPITVSSTKEEIVARINETQDIEELKRLANLFGISMTKKEIARVSMQSDLMDLLLKSAGDRIRENGEYMSNDEIREFYGLFQANIDRSRKSLGTEVDEASTAYTNNTQVNITVNNNGSELSRESRDRIIDVVNMLLEAGVKNPADGAKPEGIIDVEIASEGEGGSDEQERHS